MEKENNKNLTPDDPDWFAVFTDPVADAQQIDVDESALSPHDMSDIADMELEKIIRETIAGNWEDPVGSEPEYTPQTETPIPVENTTEPETSEPQSGVERKVRPKRKNSYGLFGLPHLASTAIWAALCIVIGISLGRLIWICASDILAFGRIDKNVTITITESEDIDQLADELYDLGLVKYRSLFKLYCQLANAEVGGKISTGTFTLNTKYDYHALVSGMSSTSSYRETKEVSIPEGYTCAQIFARLEEYGICTTAKLEAYCEESEFSSYWFLEDVEKGTKYCLEGFLFPDTYEFYIDSTAQQVFIKFLGNFENHFTDEMVAQLDALNETLSAKYQKNGLSAEYIEQHKLTVKDVVTIASIIEKETAFSGESPTIASVIYNRLTNPSNYPKLQLDSTVVYALGGKSDLTSNDLAYDSPYNTYLYEGLPPGAISNPGANSLKAALNPADTKYYFYLLDTTSEVTSHEFFKTYTEFQKFKDSLR